MLDCISKANDAVKAEIGGAEPGSYYFCLACRTGMSGHLLLVYCRVRLCRPLFEWVMENLCKNAVDAMQGKGRIDVVVGHDKKTAYIEVCDTGKGIARKNFKTVFSPGYTTKKRGWGLGLTLAKRIIEEYHGGKIFVKSSEIGVGTTFRIELPIA